MRNNITQNQAEAMLYGTLWHALCPVSNSIGIADEGLDNPELAKRLKRVCEEIKDILGSFIIG